MSSIKFPPAWLKAVGCFALLSSPAILPASADTPVIVVTPARYAQPIEQVGSSVVRLEGEELRQRGIQFVEDALREVPSLIVSSQGARGSQVQLRARGNEANHVLVLIDGIRVGNASSGEFDLSGLGLSAVDNIEVLLGPQSTLYGSDAIGGTVNAISRSYRDMPWSSGAHWRFYSRAASAERSVALRRASTIWSSDS